jgi:hypothetical protein
MVLGHAAVAELEAATPPGGGLGDGTLDMGPVGHVVLAQLRAGRPGGAGGAQQPVVLVQVHGAALFGGGAPAAQRAVPAGGPEEDGVVAVTLRVMPAGQVTVRAAASTVKSSWVKPPLTGGARGQGLITAWCPAPAIAARRSPVP